MSKVVSIILLIFAILLVTGLMLKAIHQNAIQGIEFIRRCEPLGGKVVLFNDGYHCIRADALIQLDR